MRAQRKPRGPVPKKGRSDTNVLTERKQIIARVKYHHEEHEGHEVKSSYIPIGFVPASRGGVYIK
jgi:hypothetical protein